MSATRRPSWSPVRLDRTTGRRADVDAVRPHVAGEARRRGGTSAASSRSADRTGSGGSRIGAGVPQRPLTAFGPTAVELRDDLVVREHASLADLQLVHAVDPVVRVDLLVERHAPTSWCTNCGNDACASPEPSTCSAILRTSHPVQSVGSAHSCSARATRAECGEAPELLLREHSRLGPCDPLRCHRVFTVSSAVASSRYRSIEPVEVTDPAVATGFVARAVRR